MNLYRTRLFYITNGNFWYDSSMCLALVSINLKLNINIFFFRMAESQRIHSFQAAEARYLSNPYSKGKTVLFTYNFLSGCDQVWTFKDSLLYRYLRRNPSFYYRFKDTSTILFALYLSVHTFVMWFIFCEWSLSDKYEF
jgi:hypothetical protein